MHPSEQFMQYCTQQGWNECADNKIQLYPQGKEKFVPQLQELANHRFIGISYDPVDITDQIEHAFWDMRGESKFRPSNELSVTLYCSRIAPLSAKDELLARMLPGYLQESHDTFPHRLFDRWDLMLHEPKDNYEGNEEPAYHCRIQKVGKKLRITGLYAAAEANWLPGWGLPSVDTLLASPPAGEKESVLVNGFGIRELRRYPLIHITNSPQRAMTKLLLGFSSMAKMLSDGFYDHKIENDELDEDLALDTRLDGDSLSN